VEPFETIRLDREGDVLVATIDRPGNDLNAVDATLHEEFGGLFRLLKRERSARAVLLTGSKRAFTAGGDFGWFPQLRDLEALDHLRRDGKPIIWDLLDVELPIVAAVNGPAIAKQYLLTGDPVSAATAERLGLVNEVVPDADVRERGMAWARRLAAGAPLAVRATKAAVNQQVKRALLDSFDLSTALEMTTFLSADHQEALDAIAEKRPPEFRGR